MIARAWKTSEFIVLEKFTRACYTKLLEKSCYYLLIMYIKKRTSQEVKTDQILKAFLVPL